MEKPARVLYILHPSRLKETKDSGFEPGMQITAELENNVTVELWITNKGKIVTRPYTAIWTHTDSVKASVCRPDEAFAEVTFGGHS